MKGLMGTILVLGVVVGVIVGLAYMKGSGVQENPFVAKQLDERKSGSSIAATVIEEQRRQIEGQRAQLADQRAQLEALRKQSEEQRVQLADQSVQLEALRRQLDALP